MEATKALVFVGGLVIIDEEEHIPLADSRKIADDLDVDHHDFFNNIIVRYHEEIEAEFGQVRFKNAVGYRSQGGGNPQKYADLTEEQAYVYMTYARNTDKARACKRKLVKGFMAAKAMLAQMPLFEREQMLTQALQNTAEFNAGINETIARLRALKRAANFLPSPIIRAKDIPLTSEQILHHIDRFTELNSVAPSVTDMQNRMKGRSKREIQEALDALVKDGILLVDRTPHTIRYPRKQLQLEA